MVDATCALHLGKVAHTAQEGVGDTGRATAAAGYLHGGIIIDGHLEYARRAFEDALERLGVVVFEMKVDAESGAKWGCEQTAARGGTHEGEGIEVDLNGACRGSLVDHDVDTIVLHGRIQILLHQGRQAVDLVDKEHVVLFERGEYAGEVARFVEHRAAGDLESHAEFVGDDIAEGGLSQSGRTVEQGVVERLATVFGSLDKHFQVFHHLALPTEIVEFQRSQCILKILFGRI